MTTGEMRIPLSPALFGERERSLLEWGELRAGAFRFASGVCGLRMANARGEIVMLPYQGQQIWSARFDGRDLTMRSMFDQPYPTRDFLSTFGGFFVHCGVTTLGGPSPLGQDPLHGELPNAPYGAATLCAGEDADGPYLALTGQYRHTVAFFHNYMAEPRVVLRAGSALIHASMEITNLKHSPMEVAYLAHVNFRPCDGGRLVYSAPCTPHHVRVRPDLPAAMEASPALREYIARLAAHPEEHHILAPHQPYDPEVCFFLDYLADDDGWAHSLQVRPDGSADYLAHRPAQLPRATRWISRTPDQDAIALAEPGTVEPAPYPALRASGQMRTLPAGERFRCDVRAGLLVSAEAARVAEIVAHLVGN